MTHGVIFKSWADDPALFSGWQNANISDSSLHFQPENHVDMCRDLIMKAGGPFGTHKNFQAYTERIIRTVMVSICQLESINKTKNFVNFVVALIEDSNYKLWFQNTYTSVKFGCPMFTAKASLHVTDEN